MSIKDFNYNFGIEIKSQLLNNFENIISFITKFNFKAIQVIRLTANVWHVYGTTNSQLLRKKIEIYRQLTGIETMIGGGGDYVMDLWIVVCSGLR